MQTPVASLVLVAGCAGALPAPGPAAPPAMMKKLTPILCVDSVEECLPFWCERLGFTKTVDVPHGDALGFALLVRDGVEVMLQSRASVAVDIPALAAEPARSMLYLEVSDLDALRGALATAEPLYAERTTFYGAREIGVRDPVGNAVVFAEFAAEVGSE